MKVRTLRSLLTIILALFSPAIRAQEAKDVISIKVGFYKSTNAENSALQQKVVLKPSSHPQLSLLGEKVALPEPELKAAIVETVLDIFNLETLDDLGLFEKEWPNKEKSLNWRIADKRIGFLYRCTPRWLSPEKLAMKMAFLASKEVTLRDGMKREDELRRILEATSNESQMEKILENEVILERNEPLLVGIPFKGQAYIVIVFWTNPSARTASAAPLKAEAPPKATVEGVPEPIHQIIPAYPNELRQRGVKGEVKLRIIVDNKGEVIGVAVVKSLHPYLDYAATQALLQWRFAPFLKAGKPVKVTTVFTFRFEPEKYALLEQAAKAGEKARAAEEPSSQAGLQKILQDCAKYCQKLENAALYFVCEEKIREIHNYFNTGRMGWILSSDTERKGRLMEGPEVFMGTYSRYRVIEPDRTEKGQYVCDYQLIQKEAQVTEQRILMMKNGRATTGRKQYLSEKRFSELRPLYAAVNLLGPRNQHLFDYRLLNNDTAMGKEAYVIEAVPKFGNTRGVERARIWVDKSGFQILQIEIEGLPLEGYEDVLREATSFLLRPQATITHIYQFENNGVFFPSHTTVNIRYPTQSPQVSVMKLKIDMAYEKFKFFTVVTGHEIIR
jgi:TonB family protein